MENNNSYKYYNLPELWQQNPTPSQLEVAEKTLKSIPSDVQTILDVGSGNGIITNLLVDRYARVCAIDISEEALKHVKAEKQIGSIDDLPFGDNEFDLILISDVLEHLPPDVFAKGIKELMRVATKYILIITPFEERLDFGQMTCKACKCHFHVNHHIRSITYELIREAFISDFEIAKMAFCGDEWMHVPEYAQYLKSLHQYSNQWDLAVCPLCGTLQYNASREEVPQDFYQAAIDSFHLVAEAERQKVLRHNEAVFLLSKTKKEWQLEHSHEQEAKSFYLTIKSDSKLSDFRIVNDSKWNIDFSNPFHCLRNTKYFGAKSYVVVNEQQNISEDVIESAANGRYRLIEPKENAYNHAIFVIPRFTADEFEIEITYQDVSNEGLMLNVYDRNKSYINIGQFGGNADQEWKIHKSSVPTITCAPEGIIFEITSPEPIKDKHPIRYVSINGDLQTSSLVEFEHIQEEYYRINVSERLTSLVNSNCYLIFEGDLSAKPNISVHLAVDGLEVELPCLPLGSHSFIAELSSEIMNMFHDGEAGPQIDAIQILENRKEIEEKKELVKAQTQLAEGQEQLRKAKIEIEQYEQERQDFLRERQESERERHEFLRERQESERERQEFLRERQESERERQEFLRERQESERERQEFLAELKAKKEEIQNAIAEIEVKTNEIQNRDIRILELENKVIAIKNMGLLKFIKQRKHL